MNCKIKKKSINWISLKLKTALQKRLWRKWKGSHRVGKIFAKCVSQKDSVSTIHKELLEITSNPVKDQ